MPDTPRSTGERPISKTRVEIVRESHRIEESLLYSSKGQFEAGRLWSYFHWALGIPLVLLSAFASWSPLGTYDRTGLITSGVGLAILILSALSTFVNAKDHMSAHQSAGTSCDALMNKVRLFRTIDCASDLPDDVLTDRLKVYSEQKDRLNETNPGIPRLAYLIGKRRIAAGEADYAIDKGAKGDGSEPKPDPARPAES